MQPAAAVAGWLWRLLAGGWRLLVAAVTGRACAAAGAAVAATTNCSGLFSKE
jgi:hypothetical protein